MRALRVVEDEHAQVPVGRHRRAQQEDGDGAGNVEAKVEDDVGEEGAVGDDGDARRVQPPHEDDEGELDEEAGRLRDVYGGEAGRRVELGLRDGDVVRVPALAAEPDHEDRENGLRNGHDLTVERTVSKSLLRPVDGENTYDGGHDQVVVPFHLLVPVEDAQEQPQRDGDDGEHREGDRNSDDLRAMVRRDVVRVQHRRGREARRRERRERLRERGVLRRERRRGGHCGCWWFAPRSWVRGGNYIAAGRGDRAGGTGEPLAVVYFDRVAVGPGRHRLFAADKLEYLGADQGDQSIHWIGAFKRRCMLGTREFRKQVKASESRDNATERCWIR